MEQLLEPYLRECDQVPMGMYEQLERYLELLMKWNARTNLTSIREPDEIVRRHFGESLFAAQQLETFSPGCKTVLDFGSGAGFPGLPIQMLRPDLLVTLAESQNKKSTFLREVTRTLGLATEIWAGRVEAMPAELRFDVVTMRAVDDMEVALLAAAARVGIGMMLLTTMKSELKVPAGFEEHKRVAMVGSESQEILLLRRVAT